MCRFMIGTEEGSILNCNKAKGQGDRINAVYNGEHRYFLHMAFANLNVVKHATGQRNVRKSW